MWFTSCGHSSTVYWIRTILETVRWHLISPRWIPFDVWCGHLHHCILQNINLIHSWWQQKISAQSLQSLLKTQPLHNDIHMNLQIHGSATVVVPWLWLINMTSITRGGGWGGVETSLHFLLQYLCCICTKFTSFHCYRYFFHGMCVHQDKPGMGILYYGTRNEFAFRWTLQIIYTW